MTTKDIDNAAWEAFPFTYRNNRGCAYVNGKFLRFGIPEPKGKNEPDDAMKGGDRIGFSDVVITPDMVGKSIAVFTNIEIKGPGDVLKTGQILFHNFVLDHGGISEIWYEGKIVKERIEA